MKAPWVSACSKAKVTFQHKPPRLVRWGFHPSPLGMFLVGMNEDDAVCIFAFVKDRRPKGEVEQWQKKWPRTEFIEDKTRTAKVMANVFKHAARVNVTMTGTKFQTAVWKVIASVPEGKTISYAELATKVKNPRAVRAAGTACGANPVPVLVPCHRILASDGTLGGFGGGLPLKQKMLKAEGVL